MSPSPARFAVVGRLQADFYVTPDQGTFLDQLGGSAIYGAVGAAIWSDAVGLVTRVGSNFNPEWIEAMTGHGLDTSGIRQQQAPADHRSFFAYADWESDPVRTDPGSQFRRIGQPTPPELKDYGEYRAPDAPDVFGPLAPRPDDVPASFAHATALHVAPCDFVSHRTMPYAARSMGIRTVICDPSPRYMQPSFKAEVRLIAAGTDAFLPDEAKVRNYFRSETDDLWEAAAAIGDMGAHVVVIKRGHRGQFVYDTTSKTRWHVPAYPAKVVDVTGAGDAYCGGFLVGLAETGDPLEAATRGSVSASLVVEGVGPFYALAAHPQLAQARLGAQRDLVRRI